MIRSLTDEDTYAAEVVDIDEFIGMVVQGEIGDEDGYALLIYDGNEVHTKEECPSEIAFYLEIPEDVTHVLWYPY